MGKSTRSPSEEREHRLQIKNDHRLAIALYRENYTEGGLHCLAVCCSLRSKYPMLHKVFNQVASQIDGVTYKQEPL